MTAHNADTVRPSDDVCPDCQQQSDGSVMSADALAIAVQGVTKWLTALPPTTVEYKITVHDLADLEALWQANGDAHGDGTG